MNRLIVKDVPGTAGDVAYAYDLRNLPTYAVFLESGQGFAFSHDALGRLTSTVSTMGLVARSLSYQYDPAGNRTRITHPDGTFFTATYDGLNRPSWAYDQNGYGLLSFWFYARGEHAALSRGNGAGTSFAYDAIGRLNLLDQALAGTAADATWTFSHNPAGQIAGQTWNNGIYAWTGHYAVNRPYSTNGLNQYSAAGNATFGYDPNGNLTSDGARTYTYDVENRLVSASGGIALAYDPFGRLYQYTASGITTTFLYDGDALVAEFNAAGALTHRYVHGVGADVPLIDYAGAGIAQPTYLHADHQGSIVALSDASGAGTINRYDEYGIPAATNSGRFQYTGQIWLPELGMYHYKSRVYSPTLGRFMQTDSVGYEGGINLYAYVGNDPINHADPTGLFKNCPANDPNCIETEESERQPGDPSPDSGEESEMAEIVVEAERRNRANFSHENEEFFLVFEQQMRARPMTRQAVDCGTYRDPDIVQVGQPGAIPPGHMGVHSHGDELAQHPDRRDDDAARASAGGVAGLFTRDRSFTIRGFANGTFRTRQRSGSPLTQQERDTLKGHMQGWERPRTSGGSSNNQSLRARVCRGR